MEPEIVSGDLLAQEVDVIVNSWNRNLIPWWLLILQGVSGAIKKRAGSQPFKDIAAHGVLPLGAARLTTAGKLPFKGIIHVAGINFAWRATPRSVRDSVINTMAIVEEQGFASVAFPLIGAGAGQRGRQWSQDIMVETLRNIDTQARVFVVRFDDAEIRSPCP